MNQSEQINDLAKALSIVQGKLEHAKKDGKGQYGKFADLRSILEVSKSLLEENELAVAQTNNPNENGIELVTTLMHSSGQWISGTIFVPTDKMGGPHGFGSAMTYGRRYAMAAMLGIVQDDDDGQKAQDDHNNNQSKNKPKPMPKKFQNWGGELRTMVEKKIIEQKSFDNYTNAYEAGDQKKCTDIYNEIQKVVNA